MAGRGNPQTLRPWKPGQSGNPGGRPKRRTIAVSVAEILQGTEFLDVKLKPGQRVVDLIAETIVAGALAGKIAFIDLILNRDRLNFDEDDLKKAEDERPRIKIPDRDDRFPGDKPAPKPDRSGSPGPATRSGRRKTKEGD